MNWHKKVSVILFNWWLLLLLVSCSPTTMAPDKIEDMPLEVTELVTTIGATPTPVICTPLPVGLTVQLETPAHDQVVVSLTGLQPGESLLFRFVAEPANQYVRELEVRPLETASEDGQFTLTEHLNPIVEGVEGNWRLPNWRLQVVHAQGVACIDFSLPEPQPLD